MPGNIRKNQDITAFELLRQLTLRGIKPRPRYEKGHRGIKAQYFTVDQFTRNEDDAALLSNLGLPGATGDTASKVLDVIHQLGGKAKFTTLLIKTGLDAEPLAAALDELAEAGLIKPRSDHNGGWTHSPVVVVSIG